MGCKLIHEGIENLLVIMMLGKSFGNKHIERYIFSSFLVGNQLNKSILNSNLKLSKGQFIQNDDLWILKLFYLN
jgi:hypothetical protein